MSAKLLLASFVFFLSLGVYLAQESKQQEPPPPAGTAAASQTTPAPAGPHNYNITDDDKARKNPVRFTTGSVEKGKKMYASQCALCHGEKGDGKSDLAQDMKLTLPDFTQPDTLKKWTQGELFAIIGQGSQVMPGQAKRMSEREKWNIINYLRSLGGEVPEKSTAPEPDEHILVIPQK